MRPNQENNASPGAVSPPPPPPPYTNSNSNTARIIKKLKTKPDTFFRPSSKTKPSAASTGLYFVYGTLSDPGMLRDVLGLETTPQLRPAKVTGYECKLWGQYPALLDAVDLESVVEGFVHRVEAVEHAERLAEYETSSYRAEPCRIIFTDGNVPAERKGYTFKFVGNPNDLSEVAFDLQTWLKRMRGNVDIVDREDVK